MNMVKRLRYGILLAFVLAVLTACGSSDDDGSGDTSSGQNGSAPSAPSNEEDWEAIVAAAEEEGSVTLYSSQAPDALEVFAAGFEEKYDIDLEFVRNLDNDVITAVESEREANRPVADVVVNATESWFAEKGSEGDWFAASVGPNITDSAFDQDTYYYDGDYLKVGAYIAVFGWNTDRYPDGMDSYDDVLADDLADGKVGIFDPVTPSQIDFYKYMEELYGDDFMDRLAEQEPRVYPTGGAIAAALTSGEIAAAIYVPAPVDAEETGAPVDWALPEVPWGADYYGAVLANAPNPNAAQVLMDYMVSPEGQALVNKGHGAVIPDVEAAIVSLDDTRPADLAYLTPDVATEFQTRFRSLFG